MSRELSHTTIEAACSHIIDYRGKTPIKSAEGIRLITAKVVKNGFILEEPAEFIEEDYYDIWMRRGLPQQWDVVITTEAPCGEVANIRTREKVALGQRLILLRAKASVLDQRYLMFALQHEPVQEQIAARSTGTTVLGIKQSELRKVLLPTPPLSEQRRIASILSAYDDLIEVNRRRVAILEETARRLFEEWFVHLLFPGHATTPLHDTPDGPVPEKWTCVPLSRLVAEQRDGVSPTDLDADTMYVGLEHLPRRSTTLVDWGKAGDVVSTKLRFRRGDVLFGKIRPYFHKVAVAPSDGVSSTDAIVLRSRTPEHAGLVAAVASSDAFVAQAVQTSNGTKMPRANWGVLAKYPVRVPPPALLHQFNTVVVNSINLASGLAAANRRLAAARDLLLPRLLSGQLSATQDHAPALLAAE